ncbi:hypothetical protein FQN60_013890 [Etheostoma spectabile]|uniref:Uncharacterized protein n=1 Tax=Etheostoma spectabile TaxID=54343 RepID=A0A5J5CGD4_9PERO|nr:hypothetical protein FQN60_013890 [Etheostoma spectabile]
MKMEGYGETHTSTPNTTDRVRQVSRVLDLPSLQENRDTVCTEHHLTHTSLHLIAQAETASQDAQDETHFLHWNQPVLSTHQVPLDSTDTRGRKTDLLVIIGAESQNNELDQDHNERVQEHPRPELYLSNDVAPEPFCDIVVPAGLAFHYC